MGHDRFICILLASEDCRSTAALVASALDTMSGADHSHLPVLETEDDKLVALVDSPARIVETPAPVPLELVADSKVSVAGSRVAADFGM